MPEPDWPLILADVPQDDRDRAKELISKHGLLALVTTTSYPVVFQGEHLCFKGTDHTELRPAVLRLTQQGPCDLAQLQSFYRDLGGRLDLYSAAFPPPTTPLVDAPNLEENPPAKAQQDGATTADTSTVSTRPSPTETAAMGDLQAPKDDAAKPASAKVHSPAAKKKNPPPVPISPLERFGLFFAHVIVQLIALALLWALLWAARYVEIWRSPLSSLAPSVIDFAFLGVYVALPLVLLADVRVFLLPVPGDLSRHSRAAQALSPSAPK